MKKILLLLLLSCCSLLAYPQNKLEFIYNNEKCYLPIKDGSAYFAQVCKTDYNAAYLYANAKLAISNIFRSAKDVIQVDDPTSKIIIAKGYAEWIKNKEALASPALNIYFTLKIECREGRYRVSIYDFTTDTGGGIYSLELTLDDCIASGFKRNSNSIKNNFYGYSLPAWLEIGSNMLDTVQHEMKKAKQEEEEW